MDRNQQIGNTVLTLTTHNPTGTIGVTVFRFGHMTHCHMTPHSAHAETFGGEGGARMEHNGPTKRPMAGTSPLALGAPDN